MSIEQVVDERDGSGGPADGSPLDAARARVFAEMMAGIDELPAVRSPLSDDLQQLFFRADEFIDRLGRDVDDMLGSVDGRDAADVLAICERLRRGVEAIVASTITTVDDRGLYAEDGHRRPSGFVQASVATSPTQATNWVRVAKLISLYPRVGVLLAAGEIGVAAVYELARLTANPRIDDDTLVAALPGFVDHARECPFESLRQLTREWERLIDADGARQSADEAHEHRDVKVARVFDTAYLDGHMGTAQMMQFETIWQHFIDAEFAADWEAAKAIYGDATCTALLTRTPGQRRADALIAMAHAAATAPVDGKPFEPTVNILIDQATFEAQVVEMAGGTPPPEPPPGTRRMCRTIDGTPIDPRDAVTAAVVGHVRRVVVGADGVIIDVGRKRRLYTGSSRVAAVLQAGLDHLGRCSWPGCRSRRIQIDHAAEWVADGGGTDVVNSGPECGFHNKWKSTGRYVTRRDTHGRWHTYRPDGTELHPY